MESGENDEPVDHTSENSRGCDRPAEQSFDEIEIHTVMRKSREVLRRCPRACRMLKTWWVAADLNCTAPTPLISSHPCYRRARGKRPMLADGAGIEPATPFGVTG